MSLSPAVIFAPDGTPPPAAVRGWLVSRGFRVIMAQEPNDLLSLALRSRPRLVIFDARTESDLVLATCRRLKADSFTGVVPAVTIVTDDDENTGSAFDAASDEVLRERASAVEVERRLDLLLRRSDRDVQVHPSTRLPGTTEIESEITRRMAARVPFAVCYADLDHFKEFNDRYSYNDGDRVIRIVSKILHDVVKGVCGEQGFVGHIGGDDFIFMIPATAVNEVCGEIVGVFDLLVPFQYSEQDRRAGYFFGKDRRGQLHRVPLMTLSIGVVTNERRSFSTTAQVSELVTEMKGYAKSLPGSVYTVDRRQDQVGRAGEATPVPEHHPISVIDQS